MPDAVGSVIRRAAPIACLILALAKAASAQEPLTPPPSSREFLPRYDFLVLLAGLDINDNRFSWDARVVADLDVVDYVVGRVSALAEYEAVMGNEQQLFDPNQALYTLEASASLRAGSTEFAAVLDHVSRHLSDRANKRGIGMNELVPLHCDGPDPVRSIFDKRPQFRLRSTDCLLRLSVLGEVNPDGCKIGLAFQFDAYCAEEVRPGRLRPKAARIPVRIQIARDSQSQNLCL